MLLLVHTVTGAIIGEKISNPWLVSFLAFGSHFILDWIPHWSYDIPKRLDPREFLRIMPDVITTACIFIIFLFVYPEMWLTIVLGVFFACLPDALTLANYLPGLRRVFQRFNNWHGRLQVHDERILGLLSQVIYVSLLMVILININT